MAVRHLTPICLANQTFFQGPQQLEGDLIPDMFYKSLWQVYHVLRFLNIICLKLTVDTRFKTF